ncbi:MAG: recombination protein RecR [Omnitrophica bacterium GWA2_52_8]|nr:MAG: recombination protein RecR [Omnitrophica bacterium GWA2_52_8]
MKAYAEWMGRLVEGFSKFPGIGRRTAERMVFYLLKADREEVLRLTSFMTALKEHVFFCQRCFNFADSSQCSICSDPGRDAGLLCVVEDPKDIIAVEKTGSYFGLYHVLHGAMSALDGIGPQDIKIPQLLKRLRDEKIREVILATNPDTEGETTALYLAKLMKPFKIKVTRIARGIPVGSHIEYSDQATLSRALQGRLAVS